MHDACLGAAIALGVSSLALAVSGCTHRDELPDGHRACTRPTAGLLLRLDAPDGRAICDAFVVATDGNRTESLQHDFDDCVFRGAFGRRGTYAVSAHARGFTDATLKDIRVDAVEDACRVAPRMLKVALSRSMVVKERTRPGTCRLTGQRGCDFACFDETKDKCFAVDIAIRDVDEDGGSGDARTLAPYAASFRKCVQFDLRDSPDPVAEGSTFKGSARLEIRSRGDTVLARIAESRGLGERTMSCIVDALAPGPYRRILPYTTFELDLGSHLAKDAYPPHDWLRY